MRGLLLDTHVWLWYLLGDQHLRPRMRKLIDSSAGDCWISPITIWETGMLVARRKFSVGEPFRSWVESSRRRLPFRQAPLNEAIALEVFDLDLAHPDPADRFLAATARVYDLKLLTADRKLLESAAVPTLAA